MTSNTWDLKKLFLCHLAVIFLVGTFFLPLTAPFWRAIDVSFFQHLNSTLDGHPNQQIFWALANHKLADWVEDVFLIAFWMVYIRSKPQILRLKGVAEFIFSALFIAMVLVFVNQFLFRETLQIPRESPTLVVDSAVRLSDEITWMKIKDHSPKSFPGDHATTALLFATSFTFFAGWRLGIIVWLYAIFLCLPRLITGAHWLSDTVMGSGSIVLLCWGWAVYSPFSQRVIGVIEKGIRSVLKKYQTLIS